MFALNSYAEQAANEDQRVAICRSSRACVHTPRRPRLFDSPRCAARALNLTACFQQLTNSFAQEKTPRRLLSINCALFRAHHKEQLFAAQRLTHSSLRSFVKERRLTPAVSIACALFRKKRIGVPKFGLLIDCQHSGLFPKLGRTA